MPPTLPRLRENVRLMPGPATSEGESTWLLHDPLRNRFFRIGWREKELLAHFRPSSNQIPPPADPGSRLEPLTRFLKNSQLLEPTRADWQAYCRVMPKSWVKRLQTRASQLFFHRIPLVAPDRLLTRLLPLARFFHYPGVSGVLLVMTAFSAYLILRRLDEFTHTFSYLFSPWGIFFFGICLAAVKTAHELGHALTAKYHGLSVPSMGISLFFFFPVLYTDTTEGWRLTDRWARFRIAAAGVAAEMLLALLALLVWSFSPEGVIHSTAFFLATTSLFTSLAINLNPLMRLDGYFLLSDALDLPNLMPRAFAIARWRLREFLFGFGAPSPETAETPGRIRFLVFYGMAVWIYRMLLFFGIAVFFYHFLFKTAGILLFLLEVGLFLALPLFSEVKIWFSPANRFSLNWPLMRTLLLLTLISALFFLPWPHRLEAMAQLGAAADTQILPALSGRVAALHVSGGDKVQAGDPLVTLESPDLAFAVARAEAEVVSRKIRLLGLSAERGAEEREVEERELARTMAELEGTRAQLKRLVITAPFDGVVSEWNEELRVGMWIARETVLLRLLAMGQPLVVSYLPEDEVGRVGIGTMGRFLPDSPGEELFPVRVTQIAGTNAIHLDAPALASPYGGTLPARIAEQGELLPQITMYKIWLAPLESRDMPERIQTGRIFLEGEEVSLAKRIGAWMAAVLIRESGF